MFSLALHPQCTEDASPEPCRRASDSVDPTDGEEQRELKTSRVQFKQLQAKGCPTLFTHEDVAILFGENWQGHFLVSN